MRCPAPLSPQDPPTPLKDCLCADNSPCPDPFLRSRWPLHCLLDMSFGCPKVTFIRLCKSEAELISSTQICLSPSSCVPNSHVQSRNLTPAPGPCIPSKSQSHWFCLQIFIKSNATPFLLLHHCQPRPSCHLVSTMVRVHSLLIALSPSLPL